MSYLVAGMNGGSVDGPWGGEVRAPYVHHAAESALTECLRQTKQGHGSVWAVAAPPGYGKSTLLNWIAETARAYVTKGRIIRLACAPSTGPTSQHSDELPEIESLMDLAPGGRQYPDDHAFSLAAELLRKLGRLPPSTEAAQRPLVFDEERLRKVLKRGVTEGAKEIVLGPLAFVWERLKDITSMLGDDSDLDPRKLFVALQMPLTEALTERPSVILIDDVHFADEQSTCLLFRLARDISQWPCMLVVAAREREMREFAAAELWHPLAGLVDDGVEHGWVRHVEIKDWPKPILSSYVAQGYPGLEANEAFLDELWSKTEGFPLFTASVLTLLAENGQIIKVGDAWQVEGAIQSLQIPKRVEEVILQQLRRTDEDIRGMIERASIEGKNFHFRILDALTKPHGGDSLRERLRSAEHYHRLIRKLVDDPSALLGMLYEFSHDLIRDVVYARIPPETQRLLHRLVADELIRLAGDGPTIFSSEIVQHSHRARDWERVVEFSLPTAQQALAVLDWRTALRYADEALPLTALGHGEPRTGLGLKHVRAEALYRQKEWAKAADALQEVLTAAEELGQPAIAADGLALLSHIAVVQDRPVDARQLAERSLAKAQKAGDGQRQVAALLAWHRGLRDGLPEPKRLPVYRERIRPELERLLAQAGAAGDQRLEVRALRLLARVCRSLEDNAQARAHLERAIPLARTVGDLRTFVELSYLKIDFESMAGDHEAACATYEASIEAARGTKDINLLSDVLCNYGSRLKEMQRYPEARAHLAEALSTGQKLGSAELQSMAYGNLASLSEAARDWQQAEEEHRQHLSIAREVENRGGILASMAGIARCQVQRGEPDRALETLAGIQWPEGGKRRERADVAITLARAHHALGHLDQTQRALREALGFARESGDGYWLAQVMLARVELSLDGLETGDMLEYANAAIDQLRPMSEKWPASLPLKMELERAQRLKRRIEEPGSTHS